MSGTLGLPAFPAPPQMCGVMGLLQSGGAFLSTALNAASAIQGELSAVVGLISGIISDPQSAFMALLAPVMATLSGAVSGVISSLMAHLTQQLSGLLSNLSIAVAHLAAQAGLAGSGGCNLPSNTDNPADDPCFNMSKLFGSLMGGASPLLDGISSALNQLTSAIGGIANAVLSEVSAVIGTVMGTIGEITGAISGMIASEVAALGQMINELLDFANISSLFGLLNNKCAKQVIDSVASPALTSALSQ